VDILRVNRPRGAMDFETSGSDLVDVIEPARRLIH
jgi:hypothetical protein